MKLKSNKQAGFSLIELLVVAVIMIALTMIALVSFRVASRNSRNAKRKTDIQTVRQALVLYRSDNGCYPTNATYLAMLATITSYLNETPYDPQGSAGAPLYTYTPGASTCGGGTGAVGFTLQATLEPLSDGLTYTATNP